MKSAPESNLTDQVAKALNEVCEVEITAHDEITCHVQPDSKRTAEQVRSDVVRRFADFLGIQEQL